VQIDTQNFYYAILFAKFIYQLFFILDFGKWNAADDLIGHLSKIK
jgi:hypothetical protein